MAHKVWVQSSLFPEETKLGARLSGAETPSRGGYNGRRGQLSHARVTRDPAVASSHARRAQADAEVRMGMAAAYDRLSAEDRDRIRAAIGSSRRDSAA